MEWIRRNLYTVVVTALSLGLFGAAGYFLYSKYEVSRTITKELNANISNLKGLTNRDPHPGTDQVDNISAAEKEAEKLRDFLGDVKQFFPEGITEGASQRSSTSREMLVFLCLVYVYTYTKA